MCETWSWSTCVYAFGFAFKSGCDISLKKAQRRRGDRDDDERRRGAKQQTTPRTQDRREPEHEAVPQLDPRSCRRDGSEEGDDDECRRGAKRQWSEPNTGDEGPRLDPLGFRRGAKQRQGGSEVGEEPASHLRAQVSCNYEEVSRERQRRCRGPHLWLWQWLQRRRGKFNSPNLTTFLLVLWMELKVAWAWAS
jgi:hypothetical protein